MSCHELQRIDTMQLLLRELLAKDGSATWVGDLQSRGIIMLVKCGRRCMARSWTAPPIGRRRAARRWRAVGLGEGG